MNMYIYKKKKSVDAVYFIYVPGLINVAFLLTSLGPHMLLDNFNQYAKSYRDRRIAFNLTPI